MRSALCLAVALLASAAADAAPRNPLDAVRLEDLAATRERPLFTPSRRPPPPPAAVVEAPDPPPVEAKPVALEPPPFDLVGAVVGQRASFALLRNRQSNAVVRLRPGDAAMGWRVGAVGVRSVSLERDGRVQSLTLAAPSSALATTAVPAPGDNVDPVVAEPVAQLGRTH
jgi:general secretion pathway protein N